VYGKDEKQNRMIQEIFSEIELSYSLVYEPRYGYVPRIMEIDISWNQNRKIAVASKAIEIQNAFGNELYQNFIEKVKEQFQTIREQRYGEFYIGQLLYAHRHDMVLSLKDPYFRIDENDKAIHIWCKEWNELLAQWKLVDNQNEMRTQK